MDIEKMRVNIEKQSDGTYIAYNEENCVGTVALIGTGNTVSEAKADFLNTMDETRQACIDAGMKFPFELTDAPEFKFDLA